MRLRILTKLEKFEIVFIAVLVITTQYIAPYGVTSQQFATVLMWAAALLLMQGLLRDLVLLLGARKLAVNSEARTESCICVESAVGGIGVVVGTLLLLLGVGLTVQVTAIMWTMGVLLVLTFGFLVKDYVIAWRPWRLYRDRDHLNIIVKWW